VLITECPALPQVMLLPRPSGGGGHTEEKGRDGPDESEGVVKGGMGKEGIVGGGRIGKKWMGDEREEGKKEITHGHFAGRCIWLVDSDEGAQL